jgi:hypothetical protein
LLGYETRETADSVEVTLYWQALTRIEGDYSVFVHLMQEKGVVLAQHDGAPVEGLLPTWCWLPGEVVGDIHSVPVVSAEGQPYQIGVGLYDWRTGLRVPVGPAVPDNIIRLPFKAVPESEGF